jgi:hypothetical protein
MRGARGNLSVSMARRIAAAPRDAKGLPDPLLLLLGYRRDWLRASGRLRPGGHAGAVVG